MPSSYCTVGTGGNVSWQYQEAGTKEFGVQIHADTQVEPDERFFIDLLDISDYIDLGTRTRAEMIIVDDDTGPRAFLAVPQPYALTTDGRGMFLASAGQVLDLTVTLSEPAPAGFFAEYQLDGGPVLQLPFDEGATQAVVAVDPPVDGLIGLEDIGVRSIDIVQPQIAKSDPNADSADVIWDLNWNPERCAGCVIFYMYSAIFGDGECPGGCAFDAPCPYSSKGALGPVDALRAYPDNVLANTAAGRFYVALYEKNSVRILSTMFEKPALFLQFGDAKGEWIPAFQALADGAGDSYLVTPNMEATLGRILDTLETSSKPALVQTVQYERSRLMLDSIVGLTMNQLQQRLETLGGGVAAEQQTWSNVKARFERD